MQEGVLIDPFVNSTLYIFALSRGDRREIGKGATHQAGRETERRRHADSPTKRKECARPEATNDCRLQQQCLEYCGLGDFVDIQIYQGLIEQHVSDFPKSDRADKAFGFFTFQLREEVIEDTIAGEEIFINAFTG